MTTITTITTITTRSPVIELDIGGRIRKIAFAANGDKLVATDDNGLRVWRVQDGEEIATIATGDFTCLATAADDNMILAGTASGETIAWDATTHEEIFSQSIGTSTINDVDFSGSSGLVTASDDGTAVILKIRSRVDHEVLQTLRHFTAVNAARYSARGDRVATATSESVQIWDSHNGSLIANIPGNATSQYNIGLLWFGPNLLVVSGDKIKKFNTSTGSEIAEFGAPRTNLSFIALFEHNKVTIEVENHFATIRDTPTCTGSTVSEGPVSFDRSPSNCTAPEISSVTHVATHCNSETSESSLGLIPHPQDTRSIAFSSRSPQTLAIGDDGKIIIKPLPRAPCVISLSSLSPTCRCPVIEIDEPIFDAWRNDQLEDAETLLTAAISESQDPKHDLFAGRALLRTRLRQWDLALVDAEKAVSLGQWAIAYIAKCMALVGSGERDKCYRTCDIASELFHTFHVTFFLLLKAIIAFIAGEHRDAISRLDDLIATVSVNGIFYVVQAYMYLLVGNSHMEKSDYESGIKSFESSRTQMRHHSSNTLSFLSLITGWKFDSFHFTIRQRLCEALYAAGRVEDAVGCLHQMEGVSEEATNMDDEQWRVDFSQRCLEKLEHLGDLAQDTQQRDEAIAHYSTALSLKPPSPQAILIKRSKAYVANGSWQQALDDANQAIDLDPSSPLGYEMKHAALHRGQEYGGAVEALETMLSKIEQSSDPDIQQRGDRYISPSSTRATIHKIVRQTTRRLPRVLINTATGRLHNRAAQASAFESLPIFNELVSSTTTRTDYVRIKREVRQYFQYVMLSHKWEDNEPPLQKVVHMAVYDLDAEFPTHDKLKTFCRIVQSAGFNWAWSDTCCIDKLNPTLLQEALVAMFKWYRGSAMVIVFLKGVRSPAAVGDLMRSIWNTRGWTLQEYIAAGVIRFYTEDWTLYLDLELPNHKVAPEVMAEMEQVTGVGAQQLMALRPGTSNVREKLRLASTRKTELVEDAAYSLLGIFSVTGMPAIYGDEEAPLGHLLAHVLTRSGDVSILAWTGAPNRYNSCLPANISVFEGMETSHLPRSITDSEMEGIIAASHSSSFDLETAKELYERLDRLDTPSVASGRMKLPCIAFQLPPLAAYRTRTGRIYRADTVAFGMVEIKTRQDLSRMKSLCLVHPWLDALMERETMHFIEEDDAPPLTPDTEDGEMSEEEIDDDDLSLLEPQTPLHPIAEDTFPLDEETRARRLVAHLRQPFGALLVTVAAVGRRAVVYKRVAADSLIIVRLKEDFSLTDILANVGMLDIL